MSYHGPGIILESLRELYNQYGIVIRDYREKNNTVIAGVPCCFFPFEILSSFGITPVVIPSYMFRDCCVQDGCRDGLSFNDEFDMLIFPETCGRKSLIADARLPVYYFKTPAGCGGDSLLEWDRSIKGLIHEITGREVNPAGHDALRTRVREYDSVRRLIRGISMAKASGPSILYYSDLLDLYEFALSFPPGVINGYLADIYRTMNEATGRGPKKILNAMIYASVVRDRMITDSAEDEGCGIFSDDVCAGIRLFDLSFNTESEDLYREILEAFSFSPLCPCLRPAAERNDLLFAMAKKYGVELVIFLEDLCCREKKSQIGYLKKRLMRSCVDVMVTDSKNILSDLKKYLGNLR